MYTSNKIRRNKDNRLYYIKCYNLSGTLLQMMSLHYCGLLNSFALFMTQTEKTATSSWGTCLECRYLGEFSDLKMILFLLHKLIVCPPFCFCWFVISLYLQFILISCHGSFCYLLFVFATTFLLLLLLYHTLSCDLRETLSSVGRSVGRSSDWQHKSLCLIDFADTVYNYSSLTYSIWSLEDDAAVVVLFAFSVRPGWDVKCYSYAISIDVIHEAASLKCEFLIKTKCMEICSW